MVEESTAAGQQQDIAVVPDLVFAHDGCHMIQGDIDADSAEGGACSIIINGGYST